MSAIDTGSLHVFDTIELGGNPTAIAISKNTERHYGRGQQSDADTEKKRRQGGATVFVTQFFAEQIPDGPGEAFDDDKQGIVHSFPVNDHSNVTRIILSPLANVGFTADRTQFCTKLNPAAANDTFCPDPDATAPNDAITLDPQGAYPNQLKATVIRNNLLYLPNVGAGPEPPIRFNVNVQALVHVVDAQVLSERQDLHVNLNNQIKTEADPADPIGTLQRAIDPVQFRGKAPPDAWSGCASCHEDGLADGATWVFPTGPRQSIPMDAFYGPNSGHDQRSSKLSAIRGSTHDFLFNSRNVQRGVGFAGELPNPNVFANHGITQSGSEALGFNVPSLLSEHYYAPYFHNGAAQTLEDVFALHALDGGTIESTRNAADRANLLGFLNTIDARTVPLRSAGDDFQQESVLRVDERSCVSF